MLKKRFYGSFFSWSHSDYEVYACGDEDTPFYYIPDIQVLERFEEELDGFDRTQAVLYDSMDEFLNAVREFVV